MKNKTDGSTFRQPFKRIQMLVSQSGSSSTNVEAVDKQKLASDHIVVSVRHELCDQSFKFSFRKFGYVDHTAPPDYMVACMRLLSLLFTAVIYNWNISNSSLTSTFQFPHFSPFYETEEDWRNNQSSSPFYLFYARTHFILISISLLYTSHSSKILIIYTSVLPINTVFHLVFYL